MNLHPRLDLVKRVTLTQVFHRSLTCVGKSWRRTFADVPCAFASAPCALELIEKFEINPEWFQWTTPQ